MHHEIDGVLGAVLAIQSSKELAEHVRLLHRNQSSKNARIDDLFAALDARLRVMEERLGIESPVVRAADDPVAAMESGDIEVGEEEEDGGTA